MGLMPVMFASSNKDKLAELDSLVHGIGISLTLPSETVLTTIDENGQSFVVNALIKARTVAASTGSVTIADDSGLVVDALEGKPGIHSARFAGIPSNAVRNNAKLLEEMREIEDDKRDAHFVCVLVFLWHSEDPEPVIAQGTWHGRILHECRGSNGFGYDPLFFDPNFNCTAAEMSPAAKNTVSHRARAARKFVAQLRPVFPIVSPNHN